MSAITPKNKKTLTKWEQPTLKVKTQDGIITQRAWCEKEVAHMNSKKSNVLPARIITDEATGMIAITTELEKA